MRSASSPISEPPSPEAADVALPSVRILRWTPAEFGRHVDDAMGIYVRAMGYRPTVGKQRAVSARRHASNEGFETRAAVSADGSLVGFGYGYTSRPGQWWHDLVRRALPEQAIANGWLADAFELSELHVDPAWQGRGLGRELLLQLADAIPHTAILLSTPDAETRAFRLYHGLGFVDLRRRYRFPGDDRPFAVLGARLPLSGAPQP